MYQSVYVESDVLRTDRVQNILRKFPQANVIECNRYAEIFNRKAQDFRLQKQQPSLILARKHSGHVLPVPDGYGVGGDRNYYFSTMLNCLYDCRYCFLQGMYRSAHHVVFVNYDEFTTAIKHIASKFGRNEQIWFFSGYDCDSLAAEPIIGMAEYFVQQFSAFTNLWLELRTKSTQIRSLLKQKPLQNVVVAFSLTPRSISEQLEHKVPNVRKRIEAMRRLQNSGWKIGLRFDPLIYAPDFQNQYTELFREIFSSLDQNLIHSISIGAFRLPTDFYKKLEKSYPEDKFVMQPFVRHGGQVCYPREIELKLKEWSYSVLSEYITSDRIYFAQLSSPIV